MEEQMNQSQNQNQNLNQASQQPGNVPGEDKDIQENKAITYLSYLGILFLVPMLAKKESKFAMFHAKQGLVLAVGWFLGSFLYLFFGLGFLMHLLMLIFSIMGLVNVNNGKMKDLPVVGDLAKKINI